MAYSTPVGTSFYISQTFASAKTVTAATNANPSSLTSAAHGFVDSDELLFLSGWELATNTVYRGDQQDANTLTLLGLNTTSTSDYAAGSGTGTLQKVSSWIEIPQVLSVSTSGGTAKFINFKPLKLLQDLVLPNGFEASRIEFEIGFDPSVTNWSTLLEISRSMTKVAYKMTKGATAATYGYGYFMMSEDPQQSADQVDRVRATFAALGRRISYA